MEREEGFLKCMGWSGQGSPGEIVEYLSLPQVHEQDVGGMCIEEVSRRVERGMQQTTVDYCGLLVGDIAFAEWKMRGAVRVQSKDQRKLMGELRC